MKYSVYYKNKSVFEIASFKSFFTFVSSEGRFIFK
jgi:hypothetical protein